MRKFRVFISSVQLEFSQERLHLAEYLHSDKLLGQFFMPFLFEWLPASDQRADSVYVDAASTCDIYLGLLGLEYGTSDVSGMSPTALEFQAATATHCTRLVFIHGAKERRHPLMQELAALAESQLIRRRFSDIVELKTQVYSALLEWLMHHGHIQTAQFDASISSIATIQDQEEMFKRILWRQVTPKVAPRVSDQLSDQVTDQVPVWVKRLLTVLDKPLKSIEIMLASGLKHKPTFRDNYLTPAMAEGYVEMTGPDSPNSPRQQYRLTEKGSKIRKLMIHDSK